MTITTTQREAMGGPAYETDNAPGATLWDYFAAAATFPAALVEEVLIDFRENGSLPTSGSREHDFAIGRLANAEAGYRGKLASAMLEARAEHAAALTKPAPSARLSNVPAMIVAVDHPATWQAEAAAPAAPAGDDVPEDHKPGHPKAVLNAALALLAVLNATGSTGVPQHAYAVALLREAIRNDPLYNGPDCYEKHGKALYNLGKELVEELYRGWPSSLTTPAVKAFEAELKCVEGDFPF